MANQHELEPRQLLFYRAPAGDTQVQVLYRAESFWMPQKAIAELFGVGKAAISKHLKNIFETGELAFDAVVSILETPAADGKIYKTRHYNLDAVIAVGDRVNNDQPQRYVSR